MYIYDIIIFSKDIDEHAKHLNTIISLDKSKFYKKEVEFLGYVVAEGIIKADPKKNETIKEYPMPTAIRQLRGITGYNRKFIKKTMQK